MKRCYTSELINHKVALYNALIYVEKIARNYSVRRIVLCANTFGNYDIVDEVLNEIGVNTFKTETGQIINIVKQPLTKCKSNTIGNNDVLISCYMDSNSLFEIDDLCPQPLAVIAVPWMSGAIDDWVIRWGAEEVNGKPLPLMLRQQLTEKAQHAMDTITAINSSNMVMHTTDEDFCKRVVRALCKYESCVDSKALVDYLVVHHGWRNKLAQQIGDWVTKLQTGVRFVGGSGGDLKGMYEKW